MDQTAKRSTEIKNKYNSDTNGANYSIQSFFEFGEYLYSEMWEIFSSSENTQANDVFEAIWKFFGMEKFHNHLRKKYQKISATVNSENSVKNIRRRASDYSADMKFRRFELISYISALNSKRRKELVAMLGLVKLFNANL